MRLLMKRTKLVYSYMIYAILLVGDARASGLRAMQAIIL